MDSVPDHDVVMLHVLDEKHEDSRRSQKRKRKEGACMHSTCSAEAPRSVDRALISQSIEIKEYRGLGFMSWDQKGLSLQVKLSDGLSDYFPDDLIHGLLSDHCASESGKSAGQSTIQPGARVQLSAERLTSYKLHHVHPNDQLIDWCVLGILDDEETGYLGILYANDRKRQLVLAHRSTNFALSLQTKNFLKQSGLHQDIAGVFMGQILAHQSWGYVATKEAVDLRNTHQKYAFYSLSITGHSLGAWLAQMSVFYCSRDLPCAHIKAVTFDGPGAREMMEKLSASDSGAASLIDNLSIVSYLSPPNIVNCAGRHVGTVYMVSFKIKEVSASSGAVGSFVSKALGEKKIDAVLATFGHELTYILNCFSSQGKLLNAPTVVSWPSIRYTGSRQVPLNFVTKALELAGTPSPILTLANLIFQRDLTTFESLVTLFAEFHEGHINHDQFWEAHNNLNNHEGYRFSGDAMAQFNLVYQGGFLAQERKEHLCKDAAQDQCLKYLKLQPDRYLEIMNASLRARIKDICEKYEYNEVKHAFEMTNALTIHELRDAIMHLDHRYDLMWYMKNYAKPQLEASKASEASEATENHEQQIVLNLTQRLHQNPTVLISGVHKSGKSTLAQQIKIDGFETIYLASSSVAELTDSVLCLQVSEWHQNQRHRKSLGPNSQVNNLASAIGHLVQILLHNRQQLIFVFGNVTSLEDVQCMLGSLDAIGGNRVKNIVTTAHNRLPGANNIPQVILPPKPDTPIELRELKEETIRFLSLVSSSPFRAKCLSELKDVSVQLNLLLSRSLLTVSNDAFEVHDVVRKQARVEAEFKTATELLIFLSKMPGDLMDEAQVRLQFTSGSADLQEMQSFTSAKPEIINNLVYGLSCLKSLNLHSVSSLIQHFNLVQQETLQEQLTDLLDGYTPNENIEDFVQAVGTKLDPIIDQLHNFVTALDPEIGEQKMLSRDANSQLVAHTIQARPVTRQQVVMIGPTGSGKSTIVTALHGAELKCDKVGDGWEPTKLSTSNDGPEIGNTSASQTIVIKSYSHATKNLDLVDCPGFCDNRGWLLEARNAYDLQKTLSGSHSFIMLVIESDAIRAQKGEKFKEFLDQISRCFSEDINLVLVITKVSLPSREQNLIGCINAFNACKETFAKTSPGSARFLEWFLTPQFRSRIAFVPAVSEKGIVPKELFADVDRLLDASLGSGDSSLRSYGISSDASAHLTTIGALLNERAKWHFKKMIQVKNQEFLAAIEDSSEKWIPDLRKKIEQGIRDSDLQTFLRETVESFSATRRIVNQINQCLQFLHRLVRDIKPFTSEWQELFTQVSAHHRNFIAFPSERVHFRMSLFKFDGVIVSTSFLNSVKWRLYASRTDRPQVCSIDVVAHLFIVDEDLIWPSTNLSVAATKWKVIGSRKIVLAGLKGQQTQDGGSGGNLIGYANEVIGGGALSVDLSGGDGGDGKFPDVVLTENVVKAEKDASDCQAELDWFAPIAQLSQLTETKLAAEQKLLEARKQKIEQDLATAENDRSILQLELKNAENNIFAQVVKDSILTRLKAAEDEVQKFVTSLLECHENIRQHETGMQLKRLRTVEMALEAQERRNAKNNQLERSKQAQVNIPILRARIQEDHEPTIKTEIQALKNDSRTRGAEINKQLTSLIQRSYVQSTIPECRSQLNEEEKSVAQLQKLEAAVHELTTKMTELETKATDQREIVSRLSLFKSTMNGGHTTSHETHLRQRVNDATDAVSQAQREKKRADTKLGQYVQAYEKRQHLELEERILRAKLVSIIEEKADLLKHPFESCTTQVLEAFAKKLEAERELNTVLVKQDVVIDGSLEPFSIMEQESIKSGKLLCGDLSPDFVHQYQCALEKLTTDVKEFQAKNTLQDIQAKISTMTSLLETNLDLNIELFEAMYNSEKKPNIERELNENREQLNKHWKEVHWVQSKLWISPQNRKVEEYAWEMLHDLRKSLHLYQGFENVFNQRLQYAEQYQPRLKQAQRNYEEACQTERQVAEGFNSWKEKCQIANNRNGLLAIQVFEEIFKKRKEIALAQKQEDQCAQALLLLDAWLVSRRRPVNDGAKGFENLVRTVKEMFSFNTQFIETYLMKGEVGGRGGSAGYLQFKDEAKKFSIAELSRLCGVGGESQILSGVYFSEYSYGSFRNIQEKGAKEPTEKKARDLSLLPFAYPLAIVASEATTVPFRASEVPVVGWALGGTVVALQLLASPLTAYFNRGWQRGPFAISQRNTSGVSDDKCRKRRFQQENYSFLNILLRRLHRRIFRVVEAVSPDEKRALEKFVQDLMGRRWVVGGSV